MKLWTIYEHTSPSGKVYIGITSKKHVTERWSGGKGYIHCKLFYKAILKYGWDNIKHRVIATGLGEGTAKNMEKDFIAFYKERGISYNITDGGDGALGRQCSDLCREKTGSIWRGKQIPRNIVEKSASKRRGRACSIQHIENIRKSKIGNKNRNRALLIIKDREILKEYESCVQAAKELGTHPNCISRCCREKNRTWHGYVLRYKTEVTGREESIYN